MNFNKNKINYFYLQINKKLIVSHVQDNIRIYSNDFFAWVLEDSISYLKEVYIIRNGKYGHLAYYFYDDHVDIQAVENNKTIYKHNLYNKE